MTSAADPPRVLALVGRLKWGHIPYLLALREHFDLRVAWAAEGGSGVAEHAARVGLRGVALGALPEVGEDEVRARLAQAVAEWRPQVVHAMYYHHEALTLIARELVGDEVPVVFECRDPLTTLMGAQPDSPVWHLEREALLASDAQIFVTRALRAYLERAHDLDFADTAIVVPQSYPRADLAPPSPKLSGRDGRTHIALVGSADDLPDHGRWYGEIIRSLVSLGLVVHSHFHDLTEYGLSLEPYRALAAQLPDYHHHPPEYRPGPALSNLISRYDLMGVFHELEAREHNESATLAVCLPTKAVCGWALGAIPVVCFPHYRGVVELVEELDIGFVVDELADVAPIAADHGAVAAAGARCLAVRERFTHEHNARRVAELFATLAARTPAPRPV